MPNTVEEIMELVDAFAESACLAGYITPQNKHRKPLLAAITKLVSDRDVLLEALQNVAREAEALKRECGIDPESPQAIRNGMYMHLSYVAREAIQKVEQK